MPIESQELETQRPPRSAPREVVTAAAPRSVPLLVPVLASAALLWLCFFPVGAGWLAWVALVPLLCLVRSPARARNIYLAAWIGGLVLYYTCIQWLQLADDRVLAQWGRLELKGGHLTWSALAIYCSFYIPLAVFLLRRLDRRTGWPLTLTLPVVWTALEFIRAHLMTGFPWYFLGHTQHNFLALIQVADLGGAYVVSFAVAAVNGLVFEWLYTSPRLRSFFSLPERAACCPVTIQTAGVAGLLAAMLIYGAVRLGQEQFTDGPRVALIQGNFPQSLRNANTASEDERNKILDDSALHFEKLSDQAAADTPDLIVWPETSLSEGWYEIPADAASWQPHEFMLRIANSLTKRWKTSVLIGANAYNLLNEEEADGTRKRIPYNAAILLEPAPTPVVARYNKIHRVPFGEYVPLRDTFSFMNVLAPYDYDYSIHSGEELTRFPLGKYRFGMLICFEDSDPFLSRHYVHAGTAVFDFLPRFVSGNMYGKVPQADQAPNVDFLVNISNDAWFQGSSEHDEHLAICRFRAIECRRSVARAVNMGISAVVDGSGRVVALPGDTWAKSKSVAGVVTTAIPLDSRSSIYAMLGDWLPALCLGLFVGGMVMGKKKIAEPPN
jgi:apolipoprotein N-acyltransferase